MMIARVARMGAWRARVPWYVRWGVGLALVAVTLALLDPGEVGAHLGGVDWALAAPAIVALVLVHGFAALTWQYLVAAVTGWRLPVGAALRAYYAGQALGGMTPGNVGADVYRARLLAREGQGLRAAMSPVLMQRLGGYGALAAMAAAASLVVPLDVAPRVVFGGLALAAGLASGGWWAVSRRRAGGSGGFLAAVLLGGAFHGAAIMFTFALLRSVTGAGDASTLVAGLTVARAAMLLPVTPNGLGLQEIAMASALPAAGVPAEAALATAALSRLSNLVVMALGGLLLVANRTRVASAYVTGAEVDGGGWLSRGARPGTGGRVRRG
jgi:uncharacterized membrane protein YbhN (UPF0104 family)